MSFIKLDHNILDWGWYQDPITFKVFIHLLLTARQWEDQYFKGVRLERGQCIIGYNTTPEKCGVTASQFRTAIKHLKKTGEIITKSTSLFTVVTIVKWDEYQVFHNNLNKHLTSKSHANRNVQDRKSERGIELYSQPLKITHVSTQEELENAKNYRANQ